MLVLTRKAGEQLVIGDNIKITVVSVGPGRVKIGIEAPNNVSVDRAEIHAKKQGEVTGPPAPAPMIDAAEAPAEVINRITEHLPPAAAMAPGRLAAAAARGRLPRKPR